MSMTEKSKELYNADQYFEMDKLYKHETDRTITYGRLRDKLFIKLDKKRRKCLIEKVSHQPAYIGFSEINDIYRKMLELKWNRGEYEDGESDI